MAENPIDGAEQEGSKDSSTTKETSLTPIFIIRIPSLEPPIDDGHKRKALLHSKFANFIQIAAILVNAFLLFVSIQVWKEAERSRSIAAEALKEAVKNDQSSDSATRESLKIAVRNAQSAERASKEAAKSNATALKMYNLSKRTSDSTLALAKESNLNIVKASEQQRAISERQANAQVAMLNETIKKFRVESEPYLEFTDPEIIRCDSMGPLILKCKLMNVGNYPLRIMNAGFVASVSKTKTEFKEAYTAFNLPEANNRLLSRETPVSLDYIIGKQPTASDILALKEGTAYIYAAGMVEFIHIAGNKTTYKYHVRISLYPVKRVEQILKPYLE